MDIATTQSVAEIAGSIATVLTLMYLAIQIRESTSASKRAALDDYVDRLARWTTSMRENPELLRIYIEGDRDFISLSEEDQLRYHMIKAELFAYSESALGHGLVGGMKEETREATSRQIKAQLRGVGAMQWWRKLGSKTCAKDFANLVDDLLDG